MAAPRVVWTKHLVRARGINPRAHADLHFPGDYRLILLGDDDAQEFTPGEKSPVATYPAWQPVLGMATLERLLGEGPVKRRSVAGQEHRVVVHRWPPGNYVEAKKLLRHLGELQVKYPEAVIHLSGACDYNPAFGQDLGAADIDVSSTYERVGDVLLPNGRRISPKDAHRHLQWINLLGFKCAELVDFDRRLSYNVASALWASTYFTSDVRFASRGAKPVLARIHSGNAQPGDKIICDQCSLQFGCKFYRPEGVCSVPGTDTEKLARMFRSRNSDDILEGLGDLAELALERLKEGRDMEYLSGEADPEVTKMIAQLFGMGKTLAVLRNPALKAAKVSVNVNNGQQLVTGGTAAEIAAALVKELEESGVPRDSITPELVQAKLREKAGVPTIAIEATARES